MRMKNSVEILYEIALSIGSSLDLEKMLHHSTATMLRLLNCSGAHILQAQPTLQATPGRQPQQGVSWCTRYVAPRPLAQDPVHQAWLQSVGLPRNPDDIQAWSAAHLPLEQAVGSKIRYCFAMPGFGVFFLEKNGPPFDAGCRQSLQELISKLAQSACACLDAEALQEAEAHNSLQAQILDNVSDAVVATDLDGQILYWGRGAEKMYGYRPAEVLGKPYSQFAGSVTDHDEQAFRRRILEQGHLHTEHQQQRRDGTFFWSDVHIFVLRDKRGRPRGFIGIDHDISARKAAEEELQRMQRLDALSTLAGGIGHDFNNLLMVLFANLELAHPSNDPSGVRDPHIEEALKAIESARRLTGQLLAFAKGSAPQFDTVMLDDLVKETVDFNIRGSSVSAVFDFPPDLWPVNGDRGQLMQVFSNLTINAVQAMPTGGNLYIQAANEPDPHPIDPANHHSGVRLAFRDDGSGIPADKLRRIFDPYYSTKDEGHGLGLAVVQNIMNKHSGRITVDSQVGVGTTFSLWWPARPMVGRPSTNSAVRTSETPTVSTALRLLVMDDDEAIRRTTGRMLERMGHVVTLTCNGDEAIARYREALEQKEPYDVALLDLTVRGGKGGKEAIQEIRAIDPQARIIICSGYTEDPIMKASGESGVTGRIAKPFLRPQLQQELARVMAVENAG